jgi:hypothetical protein
MMEAMLVPAMLIRRVRFEVLPRQTTELLPAVTLRVATEDAGGGEVGVRSR